MDLSHNSIQELDINSIDEDLKELKVFKLSKKFDI